jgi:peptidoglycan hydrolase-like protein with peptidoglycan-binding domain
MELSAYLFDALAYEQATQVKDWELVQAQVGVDSFVSNLTVTRFIPAFVLVGAIASTLNPTQVLAADRRFCNPVYLCNTDYITEIQTLLVKQGFAPGDIDGVYGPVTQSAIEQFQAKHGGLMVDGLPGTQTLTALRDSQRGSVPLKDSGTDGLSKPAITVKPKPSENPDDINKKNTTQKTNKTQDIKQTAADKEEVAQLQLLLKMRGFYDRPIDGVQGSAMTEALVKARKAYGLTENAIGDPILTASLRAGNRVSVPTSTALVNPASPDEVTSLQKQLKQRGFYEGDTHGKLDAQTRGAIMDAQIAYGLVVDGDFTPSFLAFISNQSQ